MATIYAGADNTILRYLRTPDEEAQHPTPPPGTAHTLSFDAETNAATAADLALSTDAYRLSGASLTKAGAPVAIAADGENETVRKQAAQTVADLTTYLGLANPTNAQNVLALKTIARAVRYLIRREFGVA